MAEKDLASEVRAHGGLPIAEAVDIVVEIAETLAQAHEAGGVNGSVCSANILVQRGVGGSARLGSLPAGASDAARRRDQLYLAPEQLRSATGIEATADIWSLAVVLYEAISGKVPFDDAKAIERAEYTPLHTLRAACPPQVEMAVTSCLQRDPIERTQAIVDFALAIAPCGGSRSQAVLPRLKEMQAPASDPTLSVAPAEEEDHHAADDEGPTIRAQNPPALKVPTAPAFQVAKRPKRPPLDANDRTQRISTAQYQDLSRNALKARPAKSPTAAAPLVAPSSPDREPGTPVSSIRENRWHSQAVPLRAPAAKKSRLPIWISIFAAVVFVISAAAAGVIFYEMQRRGAP